MNKKCSNPSINSGRAELEPARGELVEPYVREIMIATKIEVILNVLPR